MTDHAGREPYAKPLTRALRAAAAAAFALVGFYVVSCLIYNAPASPAQIRVLPVVDHYMTPYFSQDWSLFGPTPATSNNSLILQAKTARPCLDPALDLEYVIDRLPRHQRLLPSKLPGVVLGFQEVFQHYAQLTEKVDSSPVRQRAGLTAALRAEYALDFDELDRFLSVEARVNYVGCQIEAVKATFAETAITPFSERYRNPPPTEQTSPVLRTQWMPYQSNVAN